MAEAIFAVVAIALVGSLAVPAAMLVLARLGYFEPIHVFVFGRHWHFARKAKKIVSYSSGTMSVFPRQTAFAAAVTVVLTIGASGIQSSATVTGSGGTLTTKEAA